MEPLVILSVLIIIFASAIVFYCIRAALGLKQDRDEERSEIRRMLFAGAVLAGLLAIFVQGMFLYLFSGSFTDTDAGKEIFDACKTILPPLIALVIGYFFGRNDRDGNKIRSNKQVEATSDQRG